MANDHTFENIQLTVQQTKLQTRDGEKLVKSVTHNNKVWNVSKRNQDEVEVGKTYTFNLDKSEYNDKIYYWANLVKFEDSSSNEKEVIKKFVELFPTLPVERQKEALKVLIDKISGVN